MKVSANVARSAAEAERQAKGEDLTVRAEEVAFQTFDPTAAEGAEAAPAAEGEAPAEKPER